MADKNIVIVKTETGSIQGIRKESILGGEYLSFQKIPYAEAPVGALRFRVSAFRLFLLSQCKYMCHSLTKYISR